METAEKAPIDPDLAWSIVYSGHAAPTLDELLPVTPGDAESLEARIVRAFDAGEVEPWPGDAPRVTLSPWSAERLGVRLNSAGNRWVDVDHPDRCPHTSPGRSRTLSATDAGIGMDGIAAPKLVADAEPREFEPGRFGRRPEVPLPTVLLGERLQWPATIRQTTDDGLSPRPTHCPACHDHPRPHEYCLVCDRYGRGWMLTKVKHDRPRKAAAVQAKSATKSRAQLRAEKFAKPS